MNSTATPLAVRLANLPEELRSTSWAESAAVGSSMISTRTSSEIALAISTACWAATVRPLARRAHVEVDVEPGEDGLGLVGTSGRQRTTTPRSRWPMKMFSATLRSGKIVGSW